MRAWIAASLVTAVMLGALVSCDASVVHAAQGVSFGPHDVRSMFFISKSQNRNQVHYGLRVDAQCKPVGEAPVFAYWRELEEGPGVLSALLDREQAPYGVVDKQRIVTTAFATRVQFALRAFPDRPLIATPRRVGQRCRAPVSTKIAGRIATLDEIHVVLGFFWSIDKLLINGHIGSTFVQEIVRD